MAKLRILAVIILATFAAPSFANNCCLGDAMVGKATLSDSDETPDDTGSVSDHAAHHCSHAQCGDCCGGPSCDMARRTNAPVPSQKDGCPKPVVVGPLLEPPSLN